MSNDYILADVSDEQYRMKLLEFAFDSLTQRRLASCPIKAGDYCLEIGPGAGSIARWMADQVGATGNVIAIDKHPAHFRDEGRHNIELLAADITSKEVHSAYQNYFDIIHARFVMVHIAHCEKLIAKLVTLLKPGGWLVLEEPDFTTTAALSDKDKNAYATITALQKLIMRNGANTSYARKLPYLFQELNLSDIQAEGYVPIAHGKSPLTEMHYRTIRHLKDALLTSGLVDEETLDAFLEDCNNPASWTRECQIICISGRK
jgi:ubiquinone/menaquinone biosynthesis C-methylase UbiE